MISLGYPQRFFADPRGPEMTNRMMIHQSQTTPYPYSYPYLHLYWMDRDALSGAQSTRLIPPFRR